MATQTKYVSDVLRALLDGNHAYPADAPGTPIYMLGTRVTNGLWLGGGPWMIYDYPYSPYDEGDSNE